MSSPLSPRPPAPVRASTPNGADAARSNPRDSLEIRASTLRAYGDILTPAALAALAVLAPLDARRKQHMQARMERRRARASSRESISFLPEDATIGGTTVRVADARAGRFMGSDIPADLQ